MKIWVKLKSGIEQVDDVPKGQVNQCLREYYLVYRDSGVVWAGRKSDCPVLNVPRKDRAWPGC